jgi:hypothetical protein
MAKDGTNRGNTPGNPRGSGRKRVPLVDRISTGKEKLASVLSFPDPTDLPIYEGVTVPPID